MSMLKGRLTGPQNVEPTESKRGKQLKYALPTAHRTAHPRTFLQNGYPESFVPKTMEFVKDKPTQCSVRKKPVYMRLPFKGDSVVELITRRLRNSVDTTYLAANLYLSFNSSPTISFRLKDKLPCFSTCFCVYSFLEETRLKCDCVTFGRGQSCHRQRASLRYHIPGTSEPITIGTSQTTIDRTGDWNLTAGSKTLRPEETCTTSEIELACESGPTNLSDIDVTNLIPCQSSCQIPIASVVDSSMDRTSRDRFRGTQDMGLCSRILSDKCLVVRLTYDARHEHTHECTQSWR
ncbi:hypothetical protein CSKR_112029 [Clonorchis sinensis]|uniref:Uncharacterized protein n=1 Tax=Clonorchis sinensis TaxID=79923 RepID=A0A419PNP0_CLOSI|nr:hypothetical protein CSKR_112029 [Clonorchis sinensis]